MIKPLLAIAHLIVMILATSTAATAMEPPVLRISLEAEPVSLDWQKPVTATDRFLTSFLMRGLLKYDSAQNPVCDLCRSFTVSEDQKSWRFEIDTRERWSDGAALEASQFVMPLSSPKAGGLPKLTVRAPTPDHLEIGLAAAEPLFAHLLTTYAAYPVRKDQMPGAPSAPTLGPYQLAAWEKGKRVVIEGTPHYSGSRPVYRVDFIFGRHEDLVERFKKGKIDILTGPTTEDLVRIAEKKVQVSPLWSSRLLRFNVKRPALVNRSMRAAVLYSLDRESLPALLKTGDRKATGLFPPGMNGYRELPLTTFDPARAATEQSRGAGPTQRSLELIVRDLAPDRLLAGWLSEHLGKIQIKVVTRTLSPAGFSKAYESGNFDLALTAWTFHLASPVELLRSFQTGQSANRGGWTHVGYDSLLERLFSEKRPQETAHLVDQLTQILEVQEVAATALGYPTQAFVLGPRVNSFATTPFGDPDLIKISLIH